MDQHSETPQYPGTSEASPQSVPQPTPAQAPAPTSSPYVAAPARQRGSGQAWKIVLVVGILLLAGMCGFCYWAASLGDGDVKSSFTTGDGILVIHVDGVIAGTGSRLDGVITPEDMLDQLDRAAEDDDVKAVLLRIDSPGGTVAASEEISTEIARFKKPVIVSVGDMAASGAYMIASQCDLIVASPTSSVGSIGVITQIPNVEELLDKLGVKFTVITAGKYKDAGSPFRSLSASETALLRHEIDFAYQQFIDIVAKGRKLPRAKVEDMATGWVWSGTEAQKMGLVDKLGTYNDAVDEAARLGKIEGDPEIITYEDEYGDLLGALLSFRTPRTPFGLLDRSSGAGAVPR